MKNADKLENHKHQQQMTNQAKKNALIFRQNTN